MKIYCFAALFLVSVNTISQRKFQNSQSQFAPAPNFQLQPNPENYAATPTTPTTPSLPEATSIIPTTPIDPTASSAASTSQTTPATPGTSDDKSYNEKAKGFIAQNGFGNVAGDNFDQCCLKTGGDICGVVLKQCCIRGQCQGLVIKSCPDDKQIKQCNLNQKETVKNEVVPVVQNFSQCCSRKNGQQCGTVIKDCCKKNTCKGMFVKECDKSQIQQECNNKSY